MRLIYEPEVIHAWSTIHCSTVDMTAYSDGDESEVDPKSPLDAYTSPWRQTPQQSFCDEIPEIAGRICYQSFSNPRPGGNKAYLKRILSEGHGSVLEHSSVGFVIKGVSRSLTHELIRHRAGTAVSELSQRFVDADKLGFVVPPLWGGVPYPGWLKSVEMAAFIYRDVIDDLSEFDEHITTLERKRIRESARSVLPNCTETHIAFTANLRAWRNILEQRGNIHADLEIRRLAVAIHQKISTIAPNVFEDIIRFTDDDGRDSLRVEHRKV